MGSRVGPSLFEARARSPRPLDFKGPLHAGWCFFSDPVNRISHWRRFSYNPAYYYKGPGRVSTSFSIYPPTPACRDDILIRDWLRSPIPIRCWNQVNRFCGSGAANSNAARFCAGWWINGSDAAREDLDLPLGDEPPSMYAPVDDAHNFAARMVWFECQ